MIYRIYRISNNQTFKMFDNREDAFETISDLAEDAPFVYGMEQISETDLRAMESSAY